MQKLILLFFCFLLLGSNVSAQTEVEDTAVILAAIKKLNISSPIVYVDSVNKTNLKDEKLLQKLKKGEFKGYYVWRDTPLLKLTKEEISYLIKKIFSLTVWNENLFRNSIRIREDSIWTFLYKARKMRDDKIKELALKRDSLIIRVLQRQYKYLLILTKPIYFRENTICFFSYAAMCGGSCGETEQLFLRKVNNKWERWITIGSGEF